MANSNSDDKVHEAEVVHDDEGKQKKKGNGKSRALAKRQTQDMALPMQPPPPVPRVTIEEMIMKALEMDKPELIDKFVGIYEKQEADRKKAAYTAAMARAQARILPVATNAVNEHTKSRYAKLDVINRAIAPIYGEEGLAISFRTGDAKKPDDERIIAVVMHKDGHIDDSHYLDLPRDDRGSGGNVNKTALHAIGSTNTYGRRYLTLMIFNVAIGDWDDDGNQGGKISPADARKAKGTVSPPREKKGAEKESLPPEQRPQIEPVSESGEGIDKATAKGFSNAIQSAFKGYGDDAFKVGWAEFQKRFTKITAMSQIPNTPAAKKLVMNWIADPQRN